MLFLYFWKIRGYLKKSLLNKGKKRKECTSIGKLCYIDRAIAHKRVPHKCTFFYIFVLLKKNHFRANPGLPVATWEICIGNIYVQVVIYL